MAAGDMLIQKGTAKLVNGEASADTAWSMEGVTNGSGRVSAQIDLGANPRGATIDWICEVQFQATPTQGKGLELYVAEALDNANTRMAGDLGTTDAALGDVDMRRNLTPIGYVVSENAAASEKCIASGRFDTFKRYITFVGYNDSGATTNATDSNFKFYYQVTYWQAQSA